MVGLSVIGFSFELSSVPMLLASDKGEIMLANSELEALFGYDADELIGQSIDILVPETFRTNHSKFVDAYMRVPTKRAMGHGRALLGVAKSGEEIPLELALNTVGVEDEVFSIVVAVDIRAQLGHQKKMELAMEAASTAMFMVDSAGRMVLVNAAAEALTGYSREEMFGQTIEMLVPRETGVAHQVYRTNFATQGEKRKMSHGRTVGLRRKDDSEIFVEITLTPVATPEGNMVMSTVFDLSERIASEKAIRRKNEELDAVNQSLTEMNNELTQFAYAVSHDLKAPLSSILGLLHILKEDHEAGRTSEIPDTIDRAIGLCKRHGRKVERMLKYSRDVQDEEHAAVPLHDLIAATWDGIEPGAEVSVDLDWALEVDQVVTGPTSLEIILHNLLSNAVNYHDPEKEKAQVRVESHFRGDEIEISVADNGVGIAEEHQASVFDIFRRVDARGGDGIGLALVQKQARRLGGRVSLESTVGQGTTFHIWLPASEGEAECRSPSS